MAHMRRTEHDDFPKNKPEKQLEGAIEDKNGKRNVSLNERHLPEESTTFFVPLEGYATEKQKQIPT